MNMLDASPLAIDVRKDLGISVNEWMKLSQVDKLDLIIYRAQEEGKYIIAEELAHYHAMLTYGE